MALKLQIKKADWEKLSENEQKLYNASKDAEGVYILDVEGVDDPAPELRRGKERVEAELKEVKEKLKAVEDAEAEKIKAAEEAALKKARKEGDIDVIEKKHSDDMAALEASWQKKHEDALAEKDAQIAKLNNFTDDTLKTSVARQMANEISTVPALMVDQIAKRLTVDHSGEMPVTKVLDDKGQPSALTIDELKKSFVDNKDYAAIIKGTNASGGGAPTDGDKDKGGGAPNSQDNKSTFASMSAKDLKARIADKADAMGT